MVNKSDNNKKSIISHLEKSGDEGAKSIANEMKNIQFIKLYS